MLQVKLEAASHLCGPRHVHKIGGIALVALSVLKSITRVDKSVNLGHESMSSFNDRLQGKHRLIRIEAEIAEGNREAKRQRQELKAGVQEIGAGIKEVLHRLPMLKDQVGKPLQVYQVCTSGVRTFFPLGYISKTILQCGCEQTSENNVLAHSLKPHLSSRHSNILNTAITLCF